MSRKEKPFIVIIQKINIKMALHGRITFSSLGTFFARLMRSLLPVLFLMDASLLKFVVVSF